jgi:hypothetical protein
VGVARDLDQDTHLTPKLFLLRVLTDVNGVAIISPSMMKTQRRNEMSKTYLTCAETAKLVRQALKEAFPSIKFSVKSKTYSGGASINVSWTDGPTCKQVDAIVKVFEGSYFDGMTDYKGLNFNTINGQQVRFGADFVFTKRILSLAFLTAAAQSVCMTYGIAYQLKIVDSGWGAYIENAGSIFVQNANEYLDRLIYNTAYQISFVDAVDSATLNSVAFIGDDGYGYGSVGMPETAAV